MGLATKNTSSDPVSAAAPELLVIIQEIYSRFQITSLNRQIEACQNLLHQDQLIDVAILGQFKAGKSSFLNTLIGKPILPVGVIPVTTTITRLQFGRQERVVVHHFDGKEEEADLTAVEEFTSEARNPSNRRSVEWVDVELPALERYAGLRLVDTPGLGSIFRYHMETSANWLPEVGAALVAISADRPLAENDLQLIRDLRKHTPKIVLLLTKADLLSPEQQKEVIQFFRAALQREFHEGFPIFLFSTQMDTERWKQKLEDEILRPLSANRAEEFQSILGHKLRSLGKGCLGYLEIALKTSLQADQDREQLRRQILDEKVNYDLVREDLSLIARENAQQTRELIKTYLEKHHEARLKKKLGKSLEQEMPSWKGNLWDLTRRYEDWLQETLAEELDQISRTDHKHFLGTLKKAHSSLSRSLAAFRSLLNQNIERVLGLKLAEAEWNIDVAEPHQPDIKTSRTFDFHFDMIWFLIPMFLFRRLFERHYLNQVPGEVFVNLSRLAAQWEERINKAIEGMKKQALKYVQDELATIESLLSKAQGRTEEIRKTMDELRGQLEELSISRAGKGSIPSAFCRGEENAIDAVGLKVAEEQNRGKSNRGRN
ncbi:MAG: dynamin family protein [Syntrophaceae bacterium]|nr:dynamin family protein [Syntrophaceae bacterium]